MLVVWLFAVAWLIVLGLLLFVQLPLGVREARRLVKRVVAMVDESPLPLQIAKAQGDAARLRRAFECVPILEQRAVAAVAVIRSTPLLPPAIGNIVDRIRHEADSFKQAMR